MSEYRASLAIGGTDIRAMVKDYDKWIFERRMILAGNLPPWLKYESSPAAQFGTAVHLALLESDKYDKYAIVMDYCDNFTLKAGREIKERAQAQCTTPEHFTMRHEHHWAVQQIRKNFFLALTDKKIPLPQPGDVELERWAVRHGVECKGKLDWRSHGVVYDLKTCSDIHRINSIKYENAYHAQLAHYAALDDLERTAIIWIESVAPYRVVVEFLDEDDRSFGATACNNALKTYAKEGIK